MGSLIEEEIELQVGRSRVSFSFLSFYLKIERERKRRVNRLYAYLGSLRLDVLSLFFLRRDETENNQIDGCSSCPGL